MPDPFLRIAGLAKRFGSNKVLDGLTLEVEEGATLALLGASGSGKTTALRLLAGLETPDAGRVWLGGRDVTEVQPARRGVGMVFQHYALFPHLTAGENVAFGLEAGSLDAGRRAARVREVMALVDLEGFEGRPVDQLSGGQQQRVALARALAPGPRLLLLDEPLSNLDPALRERTRRELAAALRRALVTTVLVTHEQEEAFHLGGRVAVLHRGRLEQVGTPEDLYERPASPFVATFVGRASVLPGVFAGNGEVLLGGGGDGSPLWRASVVGTLTPGDAVHLVVRPEALKLVEDVEKGLPGDVLERRYAGPVTYLTVLLWELGELEVAVDSSAPREGERVRVAPRAGEAGRWAFRGAPLPGRSGGRESERS